MRSKLLAIIQTALVHAAEHRGLGRHRSSLSRSEFDQYSKVGARVASKHHKGPEAHRSLAQLCQPDSDHTDIGLGEIIADHVDHRNQSFTRNFQRLSHLEYGGGDVGSSISHRSGVAMSRAKDMGLHSREMCQPGKIHIG